MKKRQIKIDFIKGDTVEAIALDDNVMFRLYEVWKGIEIKSGDKLDSIIKFWLSTNSTKALDELILGFKYEDKEYIPLMTSPSMMKKEDKSRKCEYLYIDKKDEEFIVFLRNALSLGKIEDLYTQDEVCINKDIIARISLALSGSIKINYTPKVVILSSDKYKHTAKYVTFSDEKLSDPKQIEKEFEFADGCGFMSNKMSEIIKKQMKLDYTVDFAGIRMYNGLATKGLVVRCDWNRYFNENLIETEGIFEKREDGYYTKDYFGNMVNISEVDLILNTNMCKFAKLWKDEEFNDINAALNKKLNTEEFIKYKDVLSSLYITKINKRETKEYTQISYQVLNNLALLTDELAEIQKDSEEYIKKIMNMDDLAYLKMFLGDISRDGQEELSASTKAHKLLQIDKRYLGSAKVGKIIARLINSKAHELVCNPYVKGNYKTASIDPVCYLNWIMTRNIEKSRELKEGQFFIAGEKGNRVLTRNPLAVFSEIHRIKLTSTNRLRKYFGDLTNELIFFNQADNTAFVSSGQDFDLDFNGVWENDLIYNAVIEPEHSAHFNYESDGKTIKTKWSKINEYEAVLKASGDLIGAIANATTKISNQAQELGYMMPKTGTIFKYKELREGWLNKPENKSLKNKLMKYKGYLDNNEYDLKEGYYTDKAEILSWIKQNKIDIGKIYSEIDVEFNACLQKLISNGKIIDVETLPDEEIRKIIIKQFYELKGIAYEALRLSQIAIDAPKTLYIPTKEDMVNLKEWKQMKHPRFIYFSKFTNNKESVEVEWEDTEWSRSCLNINATRIYNEVIKSIKAMKKLKEDKKDSGYRMRKLLSEIAVENEEIVSIIKKVKQDYNASVEELRKIKDKEEHKAKKSLRDYDLIMTIRDLMTKYSAEHIAYGIVENKCTCDFIFDFCWDICEVAINSKVRYVTMFKENQKGTYDWMFKKYNEVSATLRAGHLQEDFINQLERQADFTDFNVGGVEGSVYDNAIIEVKTEEYENKKGEKATNFIVYCDDEKVGFIYPNTIKTELKSSYTVKNAELVKKGKSEYIKLIVA